MCTLLAGDRFGGAFLAEVAARAKDFIPLKAATLAEVASRTRGAPVGLAERTQSRAVLASGTWDHGHASNRTLQSEVGVAKVSDGAL